MISTKPAFLSAIALSLVLAVPGGCIKAPVHYGHLTVLNRTQDVLVVRALHAAEEEIEIPACGMLLRDGFPLDSVDVSQKVVTEAGASHSLQYGTDSDVVLLMLPDGASQAVDTVPAPLPDCEGHL